MSSPRTHWSNSIPTVARDRQIRRFLPENLKDGDYDVTCEGCVVDRDVYLGALAIKRHGWRMNVVIYDMLWHVFTLNPFWTNDSLGFFNHLDHHGCVCVCVGLTRKHWAWTLELGTTWGWGALADYFSHDTGIKQNRCAECLWLFAGMVTYSKRLSSLCEVELGCQNLMRHQSPLESWQDAIHQSPDG